MLLSTQPLAFCLLYSALSALNFPRAQLREDKQLRRQLRTAVFTYGYEVLFAVPAHAHTPVALILLGKYKPTWLIPSQRLACKAVTSELFIALAHRVAKRLKLGSAPTRMAIHLHSSNASPLEIASDLNDAFQWCWISMSNDFADGFFSKSIQSMLDIKSRIEPVVATIASALSLYTDDAQAVYQGSNFRINLVHMEYLITAKQHWRDLNKLASVINSHKERCEQLKAEIYDTLGTPTLQDDTEGWTNVSRTLIDMDIDKGIVGIADVALFYAIMSSLKASIEVDSINPQDAVRLSDQIIKTLKQPQDAAAMELTTFISKFGDAREERLEGSLSKFIDAAENLRLGDVPFTTPREVAVDVLYCCKQVVETSAARMKGWVSLAAP
jgi:hypothetical protein